MTLNFHTVKKIYINILANFVISSSFSQTTNVYKSSLLNISNEYNVMLYIDSYGGNVISYSSVFALFTSLL